MSARIVSRAFATTLMAAVSTTALTTAIMAESNQAVAGSIKDKNIQKRDERAISNGADKFIREKIENRRNGLLVRIEKAAVSCLDAGLRFATTSSNLFEEIIHPASAAMNKERAAMVAGKSKEGAEETLHDAFIDPSDLTTVKPKVELASMQVQLDHVEKVRDGELEGLREDLNDAVSALQSFQSDLQTMLSGSPAIVGGDLKRAQERLDKISGVDDTPPFAARIQHNFALAVEACDASDLQEKLDRQRTQIQALEADISNISSAAYKPAFLSMGEDLARATGTVENLTTLMIYHVDKIEALACDEKVFATRKESQCTRRVEDSENRLVQLARRYDQAASEVESILSSDAWKNASQGVDHDLGTYTALPATVRQTVRDIAAPQ